MLDLEILNTVIAQAAGQDPSIYGQKAGRAIALGAPGSAARVGVVAVTLEPAGGVPAPTGDMIVAGTLN